ncbi:MAG: GNAT family protein [Bacteroidota bacterium]
MRSSKVLLRALEPSDIDFIFQLENDPANWHVSNTLAPYSRYAIEQYILNSENDIFTQKQLRLIIESTDSNEPKRIGCIDLFEYDPLHKRAGVGIIIISEEQQKGYASESLSLLIEHSFTVLGLHQLFCNISIDNRTSLKLFEHHGFVSCGVKKDWIFYKNEWKDEIMLQLINR